MALVNRAELATITLTTAITASATTISVPNADAAILPTAPFFATLMPASEIANKNNSEIVYFVSSTVSGGNTTYEVTRAQKGTTAKAWEAGSIVSNAVYVGDLDAVPVGTITDYDGIDIPDGWEEVDGVDASWTTVSVSTAATTGEARYSKVGGVVYLTGELSSSGTSGDSSTLFTLPAGSRPAVAVSTPLGAANGILKIASNGAAKISGAPNSVNLGFSTAFPAKATGGAPDVFPPDLSQPLNAEQLANLQNIVSAGLSQDYLSLGDELLVTYGAYTMPFEIVGFEDIIAQVDGQEQTVHALNLLAKYTDEAGTRYGSSSGQEYSASVLRSYIVSTYQSALDAGFVACLASTKKQTLARGGAVDVVYDKLFAPSMEQLGVTDTGYNTAAQAAVEGPTFAALEGSDSSKRIKNDVSAAGTAQEYWTSTYFPTNTNRTDLITVTGTPSWGSYTTAERVVVACNFIGGQS